jgi:hypothetical protein
VAQQPVSGEAVTSRGRREEDHRTPAFVTAVLVHGPTASR